MTWARTQLLMAAELRFRIFDSRSHTQLCTADALTRVTKVAFSDKSYDKAITFKTSKCRSLQLDGGLF